MMYPILSKFGLTEDVFSRLSSLDLRRTSLASWKSWIFYSLMSTVFMVSLETNKFMTKASGTGAYLSFFLFLIERSMHSGMPYHSSVEILANYLFRSTNFEVIELSTGGLFFNFSFYSLAFLSRLS